MMKSLVGISLLASLIAAVFTPAISAADGAKSQVLKHVVMYKFRDDCTPEQVQEVITAFSTMVKKIDAVIGFEKGSNISKEGKSEGFTHVFVVTFRDDAGLQVYLKHPAHDEYVSVVKTKREKVVVFDYMTDAK